MTPSVCREVAPLAECLLALIAGERFLTGMSSHVHSQVVFPAELLVTIGARKSFLAYVGSTMAV